MVALLEVCRQELVPELGAVCTLEFHVLHVVVPHYHHDFLGLEGMVKGVDTSVGVEGYGRRVLTRKGANGERF